MKLKICKIYVKTPTDIHNVILICFTVIFLASCKKFIDVNTPPTKTSTESAFKNDLTAAAVLTGVYAQLMSDFQTPSVYGTSYFAELAADNLTMVDPSNTGYIDYYRNTIPTSNYTYWEQTYKLIYTLNISLSELKTSTALSEIVSKRLLGEAYFMRAFLYFYLVNIYGDVPLALESNQKVNRVLPRSATTLVYDQINKDLLAAKSCLDYSYVTADVSRPNPNQSQNRLRPNLAAVQALQARVFLYQKRFGEAEAEATQIINQSSLYNLALTDAVFSKNSTETIWALQPVTVGQNTKEAAIYLLTNPGIDISGQVYLSDNLMNTFENGDARKTEWTAVFDYDPGSGLKGYPYANKYRQGQEDGLTVINEYAVVFRIAEIYLIRAEARNELNNLVGAIEDLNFLRAKRRAVPKDVMDNPLPALQNTLTKTQVNSKIAKERQTELFAEWGHRWFDIKRNGTIDEIMAPVSLSRGEAWSSYKALYPIPAGEILLNRNLSQNPGYQN